VYGVSSGLVCGVRSNVTG